MSMSCTKCDQPMRMRYPAGGPENGPARLYCDNGHGGCVAGCGKPTEGWSEIHAECLPMDEDGWEEYQMSHNRASGPDTECGCSLCDLERAAVEIFR